MFFNYKIVTKKKTSLKTLFGIFFQQSVPGSLQALAKLNNFISLHQSKKIGAKQFFFNERIYKISI